MATIYTLIDCDDWVGIYADDSLLYEGDPLSAEELLNLVSYTAVEFFGKFECDLEWLDGLGRLPEQLKDVRIGYRGVAIPFYEYIERMR